MITRDEFLAGKNELAQKEAEIIIRKLEETVAKGSTNLTTYDVIKTPIATIENLVGKHVQKFGWTLKHSVYHGDQRDPGPTHSWVLS